VIKSIFSSFITLLLWFEKTGCQNSPIYLRNLFWICSIS